MPAFLEPAYHCLTGNFKTDRTQAAITMLMDMDSLYIAILFENNEAARGYRRHVGASTNGQVCIRASCLIVIILIRKIKGYTKNCATARASCFMPCNRLVSSRVPIKLRQESQAKRYFPLKRKAAQPAGYFRRVFFDSHLSKGWRMAAFVWSSFMLCMMSSVCGWLCPSFLIRIM